VNTEGHIPDEEDEWLRFEESTAMLLGSVPAGHVRDHFRRNAEAIQKVARELIATKMPVDEKITPTEALSIASRLICALAVLGPLELAEVLGGLYDSPYPKPKRSKKPKRKTTAKKKERK
jgi:hypothetical protein